MALKYSVGARAFVMGQGSFKSAFQNGKIEIYTGAQPATAEAAVTGTLLCTITAASAARTAEVVATGTVTLTGGASGSVNTLTVNSIEILGAAVVFNTSLTQTATDVATQINNNLSNVEYAAVASGAVVTISALPGTGTNPNGFVVASTVTTLTKTDVNMASGVAAVNGLSYGKAGVATAGMVSKLVTQVWSGVNVATSTAGWYRAYGSVADTGAIDATGLTIREDGAIAVSGAELNMSNTALTATATTTVSQWDRTLPTL